MSCIQVNKSTKYFNDVAYLWAILNAIDNLQLDDISTAKTIVGVAALLSDKLDDTTACVVTVV